MPHLISLSPVVRLSVIANTARLSLLDKYGLDIPIIFVPIERTLKPYRDLIALYSLYKIFLANAPDGVHTITPKAGLLGMIAAWLARVPVRVHTFTGQVWITQKGIFRIILYFSDFLIAKLATDTIIDSQSQKVFLLKSHILSEKKSIVFGAGSICGVDVKRFSPDNSDRISIRNKLGISSESTVLLFLGRLNRDKGVLDLVEAFMSLAQLHTNLALLLVGPDEDNLCAQINKQFFNFDKKLIYVGYTDNPERYIRASDLFCLPSYREGFGVSVIEAAACGVPALVSRIYGLTDSVVEGETGWFHEAGNINDLKKSLSEVIADMDKLRQRGHAARNRAIREFSQQRITAEMFDFYSTRFGLEKALK